MGLELKADIKYKQSPLKKFIEDENKRYYQEKNVELVADEDGRLVEL